jgi:choline-glycine betaine transporter
MSFYTRETDPLLKVILYGFIFMKLTFGFFIGAIAVILLMSGGLKALQTASIVAALSFAFVLLAMIVSTMLLLKKEKIYHFNLNR